MGFMQGITIINDIPKTLKLSPLPGRTGLFCGNCVSLVIGIVLQLNTASMLKPYN